MGNLMDVAKVGDKVQVYTTDGPLDPNIYKIEGFKQRIIELSDINTGKFARVHKSRLAKIVLDEELKEVQEVMDKTCETAEPEAQPKPKAKPAKKPDKVNFADMARGGCEVWSKSLNFPDKEGNAVEGIKAEAHCVIAADKASYKVFNTYNGTLGKKASAKKKNPEGVSYALKDDKAVARKVKDLQKKGYKRRPKPPTKK
jgi:hypothetical protein